MYNRIRASRGAAHCIEIFEIDHKFDLIRTAVGYRPEIQEP
jgi:hypothetical protein